MKKKHKIILIIVSLFVAVCLGGGMYMAHKNQEFQNEMVKINNLLYSPYLNNKVP